MVVAQSHQEWPVLDVQELELEQEQEEEHDMQELDVLGVWQRTDEDDEQEN